jgi:hypothetical protein
MILPGLLLCATSLWPAVGRAYTIDTGFTDGCHEHITGAAFEQFLLHLPDTEVVVPESGWRRIARFLVRDLDLNPDALDDRERFVIMSLVLGVRHPDTDGHSVLSFDHARALHTDPDPSVQHVHVLRARGDDGPAGNAAAVRGARESIVDSLTRAMDATRRPPEEQYEQARIYVDFYGPVEVVAWAPAFWIGHAAHTLQDSFSHTLRNEADGFRTVVTVFNFTEAIAGDLDPHGDELPHSNSMDRCTDATLPLVEAATEATAHLFAAAHDMFTNGHPRAPEILLDRWLTYRSGCTRDDDYCDNGRWMEVAAEDVTTPPLCSTSGVTSRGTAGGLWLLAAATLLLWRRMRRATP